MPINRVIEFISHFAGHFHITTETARARAEYDDFLVKRLSDDYVPGAVLDAPRVLPLDELDSTPRTVPFSPNDPGPFGDKVFLDGIRSAPLQAIEAARESFADGRAPHPVAGGGGGGSGVSKISVTYDEGGDQNAIHADQHNWLMDHDWSFPEEGTGVELLQQIDTEDVLAQMSAEADAEVPDGLSITYFGTQSLVDLAAERDTGIKASDGNGTSEVAPGAYLNGVLQAEDAELPSPPEPTLNETANDYAAQIAELGGNTSLNAALIIDSNHAVGTLVVVGDYYSTDAIIQVNYYMDDDQVDFAGAGGADIESHGNEANNVASFLNTDAGLESFAGSNVFAGVDWHVDVFDGDLYDIHTLTQVNWLSDNDVTVQETLESHQTFVMGANDQGNLAQFANFTEGYDMVIVLGDTHDYNIIYQKNVLLDPDIVKVSGQSGVGQDGGPATAEISTGGNTLLNDAVIENYGTQSFQPLTPELEDLTDELADQPGTLDTSHGEGIPNFGDETFNVLVVTGDMYDINAIEQANIVADADTAIQVLPDESSGVPNKTVQTVADDADPSAEAPADTPLEVASDSAQPDSDDGSPVTPAADDAEQPVVADAGPESQPAAEPEPEPAQSVSTGDNSLTNLAVIVDTGPVGDNYVGGEIYEDEILIQTEIIASDEDQIVYGDPDVLANELVAFTSSDDANHGQEVSEEMVGKNGNNGNANGQDNGNANGQGNGNGNANGHSDDMLGGVLT